MSSACESFVKSSLVKLTVAEVIDKVAPKPVGIFLK